MKIILKSVLRPFKQIYTRTIYKINMLYCFWKDYQYCVATNFVTTNSRKESQMARIMLTMHKLEKGMSMKKNPRIFGGDKALYLVNCLYDYSDNYGKDDLFKIAANVIYEYSLDEWSTKEEKIRNKISLFLESNKSVLSKGYAGVKSVSEPPEFEEKRIMEFFQSRNSVRDYSAQTVTIEEINKAIDFAKVTPTACNRQSSRVYYYNEEKQMKAIIENQLGTQGWCDRAKGIIVVTSNQNYFNGSYERYEPFIDGGLYAMNLVYGLHLQHIATCFKMFVREPKREKEFKKLAGIPFNEIPVVLILVGHYKADTVLEPKSVRL